MDIFKVCYITTVYKEGIVTEEPVTCFFNDINKIRTDFGLTKEEIIKLYYNIGINQDFIKNSKSVVKSIEKYTEQDKTNEKPKFCVHFN